MLGVPWQRRGQRMDEELEILRGLSAGGLFRVPRRDIRHPGDQARAGADAPVPVLIGGHGEAALRRAARSGDGWLHGGGKPADLPGLLARLAALRREEGTADRPFEVHVISMDAYSADGVRRLEDQGVTEVIVGFRWPYHVGADTEALPPKLDKLRKYADEVMAKTR